MDQSASTPRVLYVMASAQECGPNLREKITPLVTGVGVVEAATALALHLQQRADKGDVPDYVVSLGSAASATKKVGSVYQVSAVSWRDMDATKLGFPKGVTPFTDHPATIPLKVLSSNLPSASLSTGSTFVGPEDFDSFAGEMADMETFAIVRVCERFSIPVIGLRGVSDGSEKVEGVSSWEEKLALIDRKLAEALDTISGSL